MSSMKIKPYVNSIIAVTARVFGGPLPLKWPSFELRTMEKIFLKITHSINKSCVKLVVSILR